MALNIKNEESVELARELAELTGESVTTAVTVAVRERLDRISREREDRDGRVQRILRLAREISDRLPESYRTVDHGDLLYDEFGLPK